ncbi:hypothetical protein JANAI62_18760 [Jannaschia pagri]|uniref:Glycosyltransferase 2-like domain-containing protein n=1 Tax=Jannaschia pagri TaxID=2829797 RepID=A0ABQ4NLH1_9RHOB|nr:MULTISPECIES: glycosyltransferase family 2 protein [unclassified Jannaschia]GIT91419.1 hypothetical protein JANAI61_18770 [Jannaschia sp. AI_61]GIT95253.1 hypothetical protein JANAI62_18760 [Jannaschia sp. AI_62]
MIRLSPKLLARLAAYPAPIRDRLTQPLTPGTIRDALRILHGEHSPSQTVIKDWLTRDEPVDAFLTRLMQSPRFATRASDLLRALKAPPPGARHHDASTSLRLSELTGEMVVPMAAPDAPYVWKLGEIAASRASAKPGRIDGPTALALGDLVQIWRLVRAPDEGENDGAAALGTIFAQVLLRFAETETPEAARLLSTVLAACRSDLRLRRGRRIASADRAPEAATSFLRHLLGHDATGRLARVDQETLRMIDAERQRARPTGAADNSDEAALSLLEPQPLAVVLEGVPTPSVEADWAKLQQAGTIQALRIARTAEAACATAEAVGPEAGVVILPADLEPTPLLPVFLRTAAPLISGDLGAGGRKLHVPDLTNTLSWEREILGYPDRRKRVAMGDFLPACARAKGLGEEARPLPVEMRPAGSGRRGGLTVRSRTVPIASAYGIVVRLDAAATPEHYLNLDNCHLVEGHGQQALDALEQAGIDGGLPRHAARKPVILIGGDSPRDAHHIIRSVGRHWARAGRYATTGTGVTYHAAEERFEIAANATLVGADRAKAQLTRLCLAPVTSLPLDQVATLRAAKAFDWLHRGLIVLPRSSVAVCTPGGLQADDWDGAADHRTRMARKLDLDQQPEDHFPQTSDPAGDPVPTDPTERDVSLRDLAALRTHVTRAQAATFATADHWPIEPLISRQDWLHRRIESSIARFNGAPDVDGARDILRRLGDPSIEGNSLVSPVGSFLTTLANRPGLFPQLSEGEAGRALRLARHLPAVDAIAAGLALHPAAVVGDRSELVLPMIAVLATGLPPTEVEGALISLANTAPLGLRMARRLAHAARIHGGIATQARLALRLAETDPALLTDTRILERLVTLRGTSALAAVSHVAGRDMDAALTSTADPRDLFRAALAAEDRTAIIALLSDAERLGSLDLTVWLDDLRGQSNGLRRLAVPVGEVIPPGGSVQRRKLMAAIFQDATELAALDASGFLADGADLSAICQNHLGNNDALNAVLARTFEGTDLRPLRVMGSTVAEVFEAAMTEAGPAETTTRSASDAPGPVARLVTRLGRGKTASPNPETAAGARPPAPATTGQAGPRVSVAMSAFDPDPTLLRLALRSMRAQTHGEVEVFIIDDASGPDGRATIDAACADDPALRLIRLDQNQGPYVGRNHVLEAMTGDFLAIQDADDWSHPDRFVAQVAAFQADTDRHLVTSSHMRIDAAGRVQMEAGFSILGDGTMTSMFRRSAFEAAGAFAEVRSRGDVEMRERLRSYYGGHALHALRPPLVLCYGAAGTLSQRTRQTKRDALSLWRGHIEERPDLSGLRGEGTAFDPAQAAVPWPLRPSTRGAGQ